MKKIKVILHCSNDVNDTTNIREMNEKFYIKTANTLFDSTNLENNVKIKIINNLLEQYNENNKS